jgi:hypothetical protein
MLRPSARIGSGRVILARSTKLSTDRRTATLPALVCRHSVKSTSINFESERSLALPFRCPSSGSRIECLAGPSARAAPSRGAGHVHRAAIPVGPRRLRSAWCRTRARNSTRRDARGYAASRCTINQTPNADDGAARAMAGARTWQCEAKGNQTMSSALVVGGQRRQRGRSNDRHASRF